MLPSFTSASNPGQALSFSCAMWFLVIFLLLIFTLLVLPLEVEVDSVQQVYEARWWRLVRAGIEDGPKAYVTVLFWRWPITLPGSQKPQKQPEAKARKRKTGKRVSLYWSWRKIRPILRLASRMVRVKRLILRWDTGDMVLNAWLYPLFGCMSRGKRQLAINFTGEQEISLLVRSRPVWVLWAAIRIFLILKKR